MMKVQTTAFVKAKAGKVDAVILAFLLNVELAANSYLLLGKVSKKPVLTKHMVSLMKMPKIVQKRTHGRNWQSLDYFAKK